MLPPELIKVRNDVIEKSFDFLIQSALYLILAIHLFPFRANALLAVMDLTLMPLVVIPRP